MDFCLCQMDGRCVAEADKKNGIGSKSMTLIFMILSLSVSIGDFFEFRYQSRYRFGAVLSPGIDWEFF